MRVAVALEQAFIADCLPVEAVGLSREDFSRYIDYIADRRLEGAGLAPLHGGIENPLPWLAELMDVSRAELLRGAGGRVPEGVGARARCGRGARGLAFDSPEAAELGDELMEAVAFYAYEASADLAAERGTYPSYAGSKWDRGLLPPDTVDLLAEERGIAVAVPRGGSLDWAPLRERIAAQGMRNSNVIAIAPTATIANIMGTSPCIEPMYRNLFAKSNLSGDFVVLNPFPVRELKTGTSPRSTGSRTRFATATARRFQISPAAMIDAAGRRQKWIDQSQSLNLFLAAPDMRAMSHMYRRAWHAGLKTAYYLRTLGASSIEKATVTACSMEAPRHGEECETCQ
jgi:ribonucleoside-diphosphate reductase alpha chain